MTFEERVEKAEAVMFEIFPAESRLYRPEIKELIRAAFPDLYGEKPTHEIVSLDLLRFLAETQRG
jgi:hypothetical protein